jgi:hypothetical protein
MLVRATTLAVTSLLSACGASPTEAPWGTAADTLPLWNVTLRLQVMYRLSASGSLFATVAAVNTGSRSLRFSTGGCYVEFRAYATADRSGDPAYQQPQLGCLGTLRSFDLAPGASTVLGPEYGVASLSALPAGTSYFTARVLFAEPPARTEELPAGEYTRAP